MKILAQIFPPKQANQPPMLFGKSSEFSIMVHINYSYPLIFHRFTPDFPRIFLLLAIYSTYISIKIRRSFPGGAKGGADPPCRIATWIPWPWRKTTGGFQHPKCGDFVGFYGGFMVIYGDLAVIFMGCQQESGLLSSGNPAWPWTIRR